MQKTFASFSFGCRVNQAEKEALDRQLLSLGFNYDLNNPSLYLINTCAVTAKAEREARQLIYQLKRKFPKTKIIVTGCAATKWINGGIKMPQADWLIDNVNKEYIAQLIAGSASHKNFAEVGKNFSAYPSFPPAGGSSGQASLKQQSVYPERSEGLEKLASPQNLHPDKNKFINSGRLLLKIQDGCQRFCTFCIVPHLRGRPKSVPIEEIIKTINGLFYIYSFRPETKYIQPEGNHGNMKSVKEVILTAINTQAYGYDTGESFIDLINTIINKTKVPRLSFGSIHPWSIDNEFFHLYRKLTTENRLVRFFHIPLQSGSNKILQLMKRGYTREEFIEKLNTLEKIHPLTFIGTDIIVGFLDENNRDFEDTYNFLSDSPIAKFHVFRFSRREKTAAYFMAKKLKEPTLSEKAKRAKALIELSNKKYQKFLEKHIGKTFPALFLEKRIDGFQEALLDNQIPAFIKANKNLIGRIEMIKVEKLQDGKLMGGLV